MSTTTVIPITESPAIAPAPLSPGQILSARERAAVAFREKIRREIGVGAQSRGADHVAGFKFGWDSAIEFLRASGAIR